MAVEWQTQGNANIDHEEGINLLLLILFFFENEDCIIRYR